MQDTRLQHIDVWRFFAIGMVLICHIVAYSHPWYKEVMPGLVWRLQPNGTVGVQIFFCVSGFVICRGLLREIQSSGRFSVHDFFVRRAYRILPPLAVYILFVAVLTSLGLFDLPATKFAKAGLFLCNVRPIGDCGWALGHTWSLAFEEQFYLIFPFLITLLSLATKRYRLAWIIIFLAIAFVLITAWGGEPYLAYYISNFIYLLAGCVTALYWTELQPALSRLPVVVWFLSVLCVIGLNSIVLPSDVQKFAYPVVFPALVCLSVFGTPLRSALVRKIFLNPFAAHLGRISYGVYLWQQLATANYGFASPAPAIVLVLATFVFAHFSYVYFEQPFIKRGARRGVTTTPAKRSVFTDLSRDPLADSFAEHRPS